MRRIVLAAGLAFAVAGCSTTNQGWSGSGAEPFDAAIAECQAKAATAAAGDEREAALRQCMAEKGWTRPAS